MVFTLLTPQPFVLVDWNPSTYDLAKSVTKFGSSPIVPSNLPHLGSDARSIWGDSAVAIPKDLYSIEATLPNSFIRCGSKLADSPRELGQEDTLPPWPEVNSAYESFPCLGSELIFTGIPNPIDSERDWILLFHLAATVELLTFVIKTCLRLSSSINFICSSDKSLGSAPLS